MRNRSHVKHFTLDLNRLQDLLFRGSDFASELLKGEMLSKYTTGDNGSALEAPTLAKFLECEDQCRATNARLAQDRAFLEDPVLVKLRYHCSRILKRFDWSECALGFGFGPGASFKLSRNRRFQSFKYSGTPEVTMGCSALAAAAIASVPLWKQSVTFGERPLDLEIVVGNRVVTVPKNDKIRRPIAIEPRMNMYVQRGIGSVVRRRLLAAGCNLNDQSINQNLALRGSMDGSIVTIDLSSASDTIARILPHLIMHESWTAALEQTRSPVGVLPSGEMIYYQKLSSMGNGWTFEVETAIFLSLCYAVRDIYGRSDDVISVYGDDIIVSRGMHVPLLWYLQYLGFTPNAKKTWVDGPYRESCGKHGHLGDDVTPFYIRKPVTGLQQLFLLHNNVWRWGQRTGHDTTEVRKYLTCLAPAKWRSTFIPDGFGDGCFVSDSPNGISHPDGWEARVYEPVLITKSIRDDQDPDGSVLASLALLERTDAAAEHLSVSPVREKCITGKLVVTAPIRR